ncbi:carotenoid oxygenase family protein [Laspinema sp. D1]|uniref:Carotenoid oxygenase family protein n=1 Tax=Laspinema palackyanum D2a TaxID=2953684 RepID=A0ABT2MSY8_9CYAN|nr:carotenoid oxygenase family protein [Laspinema sp. D2a]
MNEQNTNARLPGCCPSVPKSIVTATRNELSDIKLEVREGKIPNDLQGHVFIVGPVGSVNSGGLPYPEGNSILNGDGMIYRLDCDRQGEVRVTSRLVKPPCYYADQATQAGSDYQEYGFNNHGISRFSLKLGFRNQLNTAFLPMKFSEEPEERLLITYDAGRPYEIDPQTLDVVTPVGANSEWRSETSLKFPFLPVLSTAHPVFDAYTNEMFTVNYGRSAGSFLETIPFITHFEEIPEVISEILYQLARFIEAQELVKDFILLVNQNLRSVFAFYLQVLEKLTKIEVSNFVYLVRWNGQDPLERWKLVSRDGTPVIIQQTIHQIGITEDYILLMDTSFITGLDQVLNSPLPKDQKAERFLRDALASPPLPDTTIYLVRRADLKNGQRPACSGREVEVVARKLTIPLEAVHYLVDYKNTEGKITLHAAHFCGWDVAEWLRKYDRSAYAPEHLSVPSHLRGMLHNQTDVGRMGRYVIDAENVQVIESKVIYDTQCTWGAGLYAYQEYLPSGMPPTQIENIYWVTLGLWKELMTQFVFDLYKDYKYRVIPQDEVLRLAEQGVPSTLFRLDTNSMEIADRYELPAGHIILSPQFVPRKNDNPSSTNGYVFGTVYTPEQSEIWIFDGGNLEGGPLCKLAHPSFNFGFTIHTAWLPKIARRTASYLIPVRQDYQPLVKQKTLEIQELFEQEVYPHFQKG